MTTMRAVGVMSGTSVDAIDMALIQTDGVRVSAFSAVDEGAYRPGLAAEILDCAAQAACSGEVDAAQAARLNQLIAEDHAAALAPFLARLETPPDVIGFHGQTVFHHPDQGVTVQLGDAQALADALGVPVVADFRSADVAAGGQGAPLVPVYHGALAADMSRPCAFVNIGGVANVTAVAANAALAAFDCGPGCALLDDWARRCGFGVCDRDGALSEAGQAALDRVAAALAHPWFAKRGPKSLDRNAFSLETMTAGLSPADGAATLAAFTAAAIAHSLTQAGACSDPIWICGGGRRNPTLMRLLAVHGLRAAPVEDAGFDGDAIEAQAMGFLAVRSLQGLPLSWPGTTNVPMAQTGGHLFRPTCILN